MFRGCSKNSRCEAPIQTGERETRRIFVYAAVTSFDANAADGFFQQPVKVKEITEKPGMTPRARKKPGGYRLCKTLSSFSLTSLAARARAGLSIMDMATTGSTAETVEPPSSFS